MEKTSNVDVNPYFHITYLNTHSHPVDVELETTTRMLDLGKLQILLDNYDLLEIIF